MGGPAGGTTAKELRRLLADPVSPSSQSVEVIDHQPRNPWTSIMRSFPISPATSIRTQLFNSQGQAHVLTNANCLVLSMAHLYKAARHYQLVDTWEDMDFILSSHIASRQSSKASIPIVSKLNTKADVCALARHFLLALGISPSVERTRSMKAANKNMLLIKYKSALLGAMMQMQKNCKVVGAGNESFTDTALRALCEAHEQTATEGGRGHKQRPVLTPIALLSSLETQLIRDEPALNFDYVGFYTLCHQLSLTIMKLMPMEPGSRGQELFLFTTLRVLEMAVEVIIHYQPKTAEDTKNVLLRTPFGQIAQTMNLTFRIQGNCFSKAAFEKSSNHIPKHLRPSFEAPKAYQATVEDVFDDGDGYKFTKVAPTHVDSVIESVE